MMINGKKIDMQKIVKMIEKTMVKEEEKGEKLSKSLKDFYQTEAGEIRKIEKSQQLKRYIAENPDFHRAKIKYVLYDPETTQIYKINGTKELAEFMGYKGPGVPFYKHIIPDGVITKTGKKYLFKKGE